jgi:signal transduction histidine kinase
MVKADGDQDLLMRGVDVIARNTRLQAQLISDLLDISRIVAGKLRLEIQNVDLAAVITDAVDTVKPEADAKRIVIRRDLDTKAPPIAGDPARLQQVFWNLLSNAIKFTPEGRAVDVRLRGVGADLEVTVRDTGVGIRPDSLN